MTVQGPNDGRDLERTLAVIHELLADWHGSPDAATWAAGSEPDELANPLELDLQDVYGPAISAYTRAEAIADGDLVDVSDTSQRRDAGFRFPVALTRAAWEDCVAWTETDDQRSRYLQDEKGRLWDVLWMARCAARRSAGESRVQFRVKRVPRPGHGRRQYVTLALDLGPGDNGEPVFTIGFPSDF
jgi:hypothetical protein